MKSIQSILQHLSAKEIRLFEQFLQAFYYRKYDRTIELLRLLRKKPEASAAEICQKMYGKRHAKAFSMIKHRLRQKLLDFCAFDLSMQHAPSIAQNEQALHIIQLCRVWMQAVVMRKRGLDSVARELFWECVKLAEEMSAPEMRMMALVQIRSMELNKLNDIAYYTEEIEQAIKQYRVDVLGVGILDELRVGFGRRSADQEAKRAFLQQRTPELEAALQQVYSPRAYYYQLTLEAMQAELAEDYEQGKAAFERIQDMMGESKWLESPNRKGVPFLRLAILELKNQHFARAYQSIEQALAILPDHKLNYGFASIAKLYICLYQEKFEEFKQDCEILLASQATYLPYYLPLIRYLQSCEAFLQGDLDRAWQCFLQIKELNADKQGWNIGLRVYEIMLCIERNALDLASARIGTLRKHVERYLEHPRLNAIFQSLYQLDRFSFQFEDLAQQHMAEIRATQWAVFGHEVIRFDRWLAEKMGLSDDVFVLNP